VTATPTRRQLLSAAALLPVAACTSSAEPAKIDPDDAIRAAAVERELTLIGQYDAYLSTSAPAKATATLAAIRADHAAHLTALGHRLPSAPATVARPPSLIAAERAAAAAHAAAALDASPELAALLASLAASEASHPVALA
jgi:hypothetical protein